MAFVGPLVATVDSKTPVIDDTAFVAPIGAVTGDVVIGAWASVFYGASVRGDFAPIRTGQDSNVQDNAVLHADLGAPCTVGRARVTIGHGAVVHVCTIEDDCLIGMHTTVMNPRLHATRLPAATFKTKPVAAERVRPLHDLIGLEPEASIPD